MAHTKIMPTEMLVLAINAAMVASCIKLSTWIANEELDKENLQAESDARDSEVNQESENASKNRLEAAKDPNQDSKKGEGDGEQLSYEEQIQALRDDYARFRVKLAAERSYPGWIASIGSYQGALGLVCAVAVLTTAMAMAERPSNFFELIGMSPSKMMDPMAGRYIVGAIRAGLDPSIGFDVQETQYFVETMRDAHLRSKYDLFGSSEIRLNTFTDLFQIAYHTVFVYGFWCVFMMFICSFSPRVQDAQVSSILVLGIAMFLDLSVTFEQSSIRENYFFGLVPGFDNMTTFERLCYFRHLCIPPLLSACIFYASYTYVDYERAGTDTIIQGSLDTITALENVNSILGNCGLRRRIIEQSAEENAASSDEAAIKSRQELVNRLRQRTRR
eukprot:CAMPEP_0184547450 /NCGR_PEP_ID=MMETSP0199_2-20130426/5583_1 /TAXON_ID=1112570 /ORGANISM="Thraustochytrium sp., Strain LLF1b" /LENGTH=388 /DNA_ID=CAMNT_0026941949 /DNA_START=135 /DNA_END=1301 /DNA_ORIENTATION=+